MLSRRQLYAINKKRKKNQQATQERVRRRSPSGKRSFALSRTNNQTVGKEVGPFSETVWRLG